MILWGIVLCRLLFPYDLKSAVSVYTLMQKSPSLTDRTGQVQIAEFLPIEREYRGAESAKVNHPVKEAGTFPVWPVIWMVGALLCFSYYVFSYIRSYRKFRQSLPIGNKMLKEWYMTHGLKRKLLVRQSDQISAPLTYGFFRPVILMPKTSDWENNRQISYILEHEYVHIQNFDAASKLVMAAAVCIHWFNPLVWVMYILFNRDIELSCDETVIRRFGESTRTAYAKLLVSMEEKKSSLVPFGSSFSKTAIEERITAIMKIKKTSFVMIVLAAAMVAGITAVFATSAATDAGVTDRISGTDFTDAEYQKLLALKYEGYEKMSVAEYQKRVWKDIDTQTYRELLDRFSQDDTIYNLRDVNDISGFLNYILVPLAGERWQSHEFSGYAATDYPYPCDQANFEYTFTLTILDADKLTVGEYADARICMCQGLNNILEGKSAEELQDETEMNRYILQQTSMLAKQYATASLKITVDDWIYKPLVNMPEEDEALLETVSGQIEEELSKTLEPYIPLGLTYEYDSLISGYRMYYQGKEVKSITDETAGIWISERAGSGIGIYDEDAVELFAVYEDGELVGLREADAQEEAVIAAQRNSATEEWEYRKSHYGTEEDYRSLLLLKTEDYQNMRLSDFNARLLEWADADYDRMERINTDMAWKDWQVNLSEEEQLFVTLTVCASGMENAKLVQSNYTGGPEEDPVFGEYTLDKSEEKNKRSAWCNLYYQFSYHIPDKSKIKVGERDRCIGGMLNSIQTFWEETSLDELLKMEKSDILAVLQSFAERHSNELISVSIDAVQVEKMDERNIE